MVTIHKILSLGTEALKSRLKLELKRRGYSVKHASGFVYGAGGNMMLIAHMDTVLRPSKIYYDPKEQVYWGPDGLGADDRAGVWGILWLLDHGMRPSVLFTDGEESGGWGAKIAVRKIAPAHVNVLIEIDRRGCMEAVYYGCGSQQIRNWIEAAGFDENFGTFSDVSVLGEDWDIAAVNLSAGYYNEHTCTEYLVMKDLMKTLRAILRLDAPAERWPHDTEQYKHRNTLLYAPGEDMYYPEETECEYCGCAIWPGEEIRFWGEHQLCEHCYKEIKKIMMEGK